jgi:D-3-phosphoglycerate dehydrogenase
MKKVVLTFDVGNTELEQKMLAEVGGELVQASCNTEAETLRACSGPGIVALLVGPATQVTRKVIKGLPDLKVLSRMGVGYDNIDVAAATERNIPVSIVLDYCISEVSDHAMAFILALARRVYPLNRAVREGRWADVPGVRAPILRLSGTTLGIVGMGRIGSSLASRARAFGMKVLVYDPYLTKEAAEKSGAELVDLDRLLAGSDFVSVHAPLTAETHHFFNMDTFKKMKQTAYLINNARGGLVNEKDLYTAVTRGYIAGAGLDVTDPEPPAADNPLFKLDNVLITGHASWYSKEAAIELRQKSVANVVTVLKGGWPPSLANPGVKSRS